MAKIINEVLDLVRMMETPEYSWNQLLELCASDKPSETWVKLPPPNIERDIEGATKWISAELSERGEGRRGIYLGLDTLNMEDRGPRYCRPKNVEIGFSSKGDPSRLDQDYIFHCEVYGQDHLIESLRDLKRAYNRSDISSPADYQLFLGYSGIVLLSAFERLKPNDFIATWGFHDGDMFLLCRSFSGNHERIVQL